MSLSKNILKNRSITKYDTNIIQKTPYDLYLFCFKDGREKKDFIIAPTYQRAIVWTTKQYLKFIESIFRGIVPNPIIIVINTEKNTKTVIDGKQRITAIFKFINNEIPYYIIEENKAIVYWFSEIKKDDKIEEEIKEIENNNDFEHRILPPELKSVIESEIQLTIVQYKNLTYEDQVDIFSRIQYGVAISRGSFLKSLISNEKITEYIMEMADRYKEYFGRYVKDVKTDEHILYLVETLFMLEDDGTQIKKTTVERKLKKLNLKEIKKLDEKYEEFIKDMYSKRILNKYNLPKKIIINLLLYVKKNNMDNIDIEKMEFVVDKIYNLIHKKNKIISSNNTKITELIDKLYNQDYDEDDNTDSNSDDDVNYDSE